MRFKKFLIIAGVMLACAPVAAQLQGRDREVGDAIKRDFVCAIDYTGTFRVDLAPGTYTVNVTMGDSTLPQGPMNLAIQGQIVNQSFNTSANQFYVGTRSVTITTAPLEITFSAAHGKYWVANAITVTSGAQAIHQFDLGLDGSPIAAGCTGISASSEYDPEIGYGWPVNPTSRLNIIKIPDTASPAFPTQSDYMIALERFPLYGERGWVPGTNGKPGYFGGPEHEELSMRSMGNYIFTYAVLATDPAYDSTVTSVSQALLLARARECLLHMTRSHVTGDITRPNGSKWGNHWQSAWWTVRMTAGARLIWHHLNLTERAEVERVLVHEANRHLNRTVPNGAVSDTKSEENAWDAEVLAWAYAMLPSHTNRAAWLNKVREFNMNTLSIPSDNTSTTLIDGRTVGQWVYTANIHPDFTIENHGSYHFCYMACPLHSAAWSYYGYLANETTPPATLYHHVRHVYHRIADTWLADGRFAYMSGKDWPRYAYGLYFIMPALGMLQNEDDDSLARLMERERFRLFEWESRFSQDGTFFSKRFTNNVFSGRLLEYETDCAANLALTYMLHKLKPAPPAADPETFLAQPVTFGGGPAQTAYTRDAHWFVSWSWKTLSRRASLGLIVPHAAADLAEWTEDQLLSSYRLKGLTATPARSIAWSNEAALPNNLGIAAIGVQNYTHGTTPEISRDTAFAAITPLHRAIVFDRLTALQPVILNNLSGPRLHFSNDIFNGNTRTIKSATAASNLRGAGGVPTPLDLNSNWLNIDDHLGAAFIPNSGTTANGRFFINDTGARQSAHNSLCFETVEVDRSTSETAVAAGAEIRASAMIFETATAGTTQWLASSPDLARLPTLNPDIIVLLVPGENGTSYIVGANFTNFNYPYSWTLPPNTSIQNPHIQLDIPPRSVAVKPTPSVPASSKVNTWELY